jgi:hypothetical protein
MEAVVPERAKKERSFVFRSKHSKSFLSSIKKTKKRKNYNKKKTSSTKKKIKVLKIWKKLLQKILMSKKFSRSEPQSPKTVTSEGPLVDAFEIRLVSSVDECEICILSRQEKEVEDEEFLEKKLQSEQSVNAEETPVLDLSDLLDCIEEEEEYFPERDLDMHIPDTPNTLALCMITTMIAFQIFSC